MSDTPPASTGTADRPPAGPTMPPMAAPAATISTTATTADRVPLGALASRLGIELLEAAPDRVVATMPVAGNTQPYGLLNGGATVALAETIGSLAAALHAGPGRGAVGIEISATHHRGIRDGIVTAIATPLHLGARTASYEIVVTDASGRRICTSRLTCLLVEAPTATRESLPAPSSPG